MAVAVGTAGIAVYLATRAPDIVTLGIVDGSRIGTIQGNLTSYGSLNPLVLDFTATTFANGTSIAMSALTLNLHTWTFFNGGCSCIEVDIDATAAGSFASALRVTSMGLTVNQTGANGSLQSFAFAQSGTNVSFDPGQSIAVFNGTGILSAAVVARSSTTTRFAYSDAFMVHGRALYNRFVGFEAVVSGAFEPTVNVGILLTVVNVPGGMWS